ncbi:MAG: TonB-dependent receptor [Bacteroidota bacterium]|nr:TonB-dependent receptor [Bacteroidota bacterium]
MKKIFILFLLFSYQILCAQTTISGTIKDKDTKESLIGANILIKGTSIGTATNLDGFFQINTSDKLPVILIISYLGYTEKEVVINSNKKNRIILLSVDNKTLKEVKVIDSRLTQKQKESPLTVEAMDIMAIKETPAANFYDGLGALKGVDITAASLGFKIINTRGFNSTSPVRSLQMIDGVDNQAPGLNFSLGNFLGSSELDVMKVEIIQGASSAYFGPNAFNGVISMTTRNPFIRPGLSILLKVGDRNLLENAFRLAQVFKNKDGEDKFAYKLNLSYMQAYDWEANNLAAVDGTEMDENNPGGYDAVNRYGDEDTDGNLNELISSDNRYYKSNPGLGNFYRTGYMEKDVVDYNTQNLKLGTAFHYKLKPETELIYALNYGRGTTVYQGENRFSLKGIQFWQNRLEINKKDKFFLRVYRSQEDAGKSYDAVSTALELQNYGTTIIGNQPLNYPWYNAYMQNWDDIGGFEWGDIGWSFPELTYDSTTAIWFWEFEGEEIEFNLWKDLTDSVLLANVDLLQDLHNTTRVLTDDNRLIPGTQEFENALKDITSKISYLEGGTGFYDKSALNHIHGEYQFDPEFAKIKVGANFRIYQPDSKGSIFIDTNNVPIVNREFGIYSGIEKNILGELLRLNGTFRLDKNENFDYLLSPAASIVYKPTEKDIIRLSFSSAIRNPTLSDQYLYYNTGRAILIGNISGHGSDEGPHYDNLKENMVTLESLIDILDQDYNNLVFLKIDPIRPEQAKSVELGYRTTLFDRLYLDANYYYAQYTDFIGYKIGVKFDWFETVLPPFFNDTIQSISLQSIQAYRIAANATNTVTTQGASLGLNYFLNPNFTINGNFTWNRLNEEGTEDPIIPAYNTPEFKYNIGLIGREINLSKDYSLLKNYGFSINYKWVEGFQYEGSPQFTGFVPTYSLLDAQISKALPKLKSTIKVGASNLLDNLHYEVYGGPYIGRMLYCSLVIELY